MCGIAGLISKGGVTSDIGTEMTEMLQALKHRGPDSTGYALYGKGEEGIYILRFKVAEQEEMRTGFKIHHQVVERREAVEARMAEMGAEITAKRGGDRIRLSLSLQIRRRSETPDRLHRGHRRRRDPVHGHGPRTDQGPRRRGHGGRSVRPARASTARTPSGTPAWRPNPTSISARRIPTGPTRSATSPWCTTAS